MLIEVGPVQTLGTSGRPALRIGAEPKVDGTAGGRRLMWLGDDPAFELSHWCGTCQFLFKRLEGANETLSLPEHEAALRVGIDHIDNGVAETFGALMPEGLFQPLLLEIQPRLTVPGRAGDYFSEEQVATWGLEAFWGLPVYPQTPYYRTWQTAVDSQRHLFEFVVPMIPPWWNDPERVRDYVALLGASASPTAVSVSILDVSSPVIVGPFATDSYEHWGLTHFLLDGHHKVQAAAESGRRLRLLSLLAVEQGLATREQVARLTSLRKQAEQLRPAGPSR